MSGLFINKIIIKYNNFGFVTIFLVPVSLFIFTQSPVWPKLQIKQKASVKTKQLQYLLELRSLKTTTPKITINRTQL